MADAATGVTSELSTGRSLLGTGGLFLMLQLAGLVGYQLDNLVIAQILGSEQGPGVRRAGQALRAGADAPLVRPHAALACLPRIAGSRRWSLGAPDVTPIHRARGRHQHPEQP